MPDLSNTCKDILLAPYQSKVLKDALEILEAVGQKPCEVFECNVEDQYAYPCGKTGYVTCIDCGGSLCQKHTEECPECHYLFCQQCKEEHPCGSEQI